MGVGKSTFTFSNSSIVVGEDSTTINIIRENQSYNHRIATSHGTIATLPVGVTSFTWAPSASDLEAFIIESPRSKSFNIMIILYTYNGTKEVGWYTAFLTLTLRNEDISPTIIIGDISDSSGCYDNYGFLVSGKSTLQLPYSIQTKYGASIESVYGSYLTSTLYTKNSSGTFEFPVQTETNDRMSLIEIKVVDSRGGISTVVKQTGVYKYSNAPNITKIDVYRSDEDGTKNDSGAFASVALSYVSSIVGPVDNSHNYSKLTIKYGKSSEEARISNQYTLLTSKGNKVYTFGGIEPDTNYDFEVKIEDDFSSVTENRILSNDGTMIDISGDGKLITIGNINNTKTDVYGRKLLVYDPINNKRVGIIDSYIIGTASEEGVAEITLGNNTPKGTAGNSTGKLYLYGDSNRYVAIQPPSGLSSSNPVVTLPAATGTLARKQDIVGVWTLRRTSAGAMKFTVKSPCYCEGTHRTLLAGLKFIVQGCKTTSSSVYSTGEYVLISTSLSGNPIWILPDGSTGNATAVSVSCSDNSTSLSGVQTLTFTITFTGQAYSFVTCYYDGYYQTVS